MTSLRVLLIEDDNDDYVLTRDLLREIPAQEFILDWAYSPELAYSMIAAAPYELCLLDYNLGAATGLDILRELRALGFEQPVVILTGQDDYATDVEMMKAGADDYLLKSELTARLLERSIRYSIERRRMTLALRESEHRLTDALARSESRFRRLSDSNMIGIIIADVRGPITETNDAFLSMLGYSGASLTEYPLNSSDITPPEYHPADAIAAAEILSRGFCTPYEKAFIRRDGTVVPVLYGGALMDGTEAETVAFVMDLSERKQWEQETHAARERAEGANRAKDDFLAMLSHELRTPLTPVLGVLDVLRGNDLSPEEMPAYIDILQRNIMVETHLIDDLLDMSRILRDKLPLTLNAVDLRAIITNALAVSERDLLEKRIAISTDFDADNHTATGDAARLQQVFWNLIKNAAKFTPEGGSVTIRSRTLELGACEISISDTGIGIAQSMLTAIFDPFEQGGKATNRNFGGLGLGLSISKRLIEMHDGIILAESPGLGLGATFIVRLPIVAGEGGGQLSS